MDLAIASRSGDDRFVNHGSAEKTAGKTLRENHEVRAAENGGPHGLVD
jgi:hypothetical protein